MDKIRVSGRAHLRLKKSSGVVYSWDEKNLVVEGGLALLATRMAGNSASPPSYMACGTNNAATTVAMTALQGTEVQRVNAPASPVGATVTYSAVFGPNLVSSATVQEYGLFNDSVSGTMFCRFLSSPVELDPGDEFTVTWAIMFEPED